MTDKIKEVATAIKSGIDASDFVRVQANGPIDELAFDQFCQTLAMDAIEAMRDPTEAMVKVGTDARWQSVVRDANSAREIWQAMIDEALKPPSSTATTPE